MDRGERDSTKPRHNFYLTVDPLRIDNSDFKRLIVKSCSSANVALALQRISSLWALWYLVVIYYYILVNTHIYI